MDGLYVALRCYLQATYVFRTHAPCVRTCQLKVRTCQSLISSVSSVLLSKKNLLLFYSFVLLLKGLLNADARAVRPYLSNESPSVSFVLLSQPTAIGASTHLSPTSSPVQYFSALQRVILGAE